MSRYEMWMCDWHDQDGNATYEHDARERGWVLLHRREYRETVFRAIPGTSVEEFALPARWHDDYAHICEECVKDPQCRLHFSGWKPDENADAWNAYKETDVA